MLRARDVLELSRRFRGTLTKAESDVIYTNILVIFGVEFFLGISQVRSVIIRCLGPTLVSWLYTAGTIELYVCNANTPFSACCSVYFRYECHFDGAACRKSTFGADPSAVLGGPSSAVPKAIRPQISDCTDSLSYIFINACL